MKKTTILIIVVLFMVIGYAAYNTTINIYGNGKLAENLSDFKVYLSNLKVNGKEVNGIYNTKDGFTINDINGDISVDIVNDSTEYDTESYLECDVDNTWDFDYTGGEQTFTAPITGTYKLEVWGAQGGNTAYTKSKEIYRNGGYGAYAFGEYKATSGSAIYVTVGGSGNSTSVDYTNNSKKCSILGGFNGGGNAFVENCIDAGGSGGGATHFATTSGILSNLENKKDSILIVAGGGGGSYAFSSYAAHGGNAGGITGNTPSDLNNGGLCNNNRTLTIGKKATQTESGTTSGCYLDSSASSAGFGYGASVDKSWGSGGGGGFYGGGSGITAYGAGGGSSYIGNPLLLEKVMYCNNCTESNEISTKTISTTCTSATPTANCAKQENGYARITLISSPTSITTDKVTLSAQESTSQNLKNIVGKSLTCKLKLNKISRAEKAYTGQREWLFNYTGGEQTFTAPVNGKYKLEVWGAQGGNNGSEVTSKFPYTNNYLGGYGGYAAGLMDINVGKMFYVNVGSQGESSSFKNRKSLGGYNGGGSGGIGTYDYWINHRKESNPIGSAGGGGATHIATASGLLSTLKKTQENILIVAGGGGGATPAPVISGSGGGISGGNGYICNGSYILGGTQLNGFSFGKGQDGHDSKQATDSDAEGSGGGGAGFYGGFSYQGIETKSDAAGGGGSGYIGNTLLTEKTMYCYNCQESSEISTKTISTTCTSATPTENCAKQGNGYARITLVSIK